MLSTGRFTERITLLASILVGGALTIAAVRLALHGFDLERQAWLTIFQYAILAILVGGLMVLAIRRATSRVWWEALLAVGSCVGVWYSLVLFQLPVAIALSIASVVTLLVFFLRVVILQNLFFLLGAAGVSIAIAMWFPVEVMIVGLVLIVAYDTVALAPGGAVDALRAALTRFAIVPGIILPSSLRGFLGFVDDVARPVVGREAPLLLGVGDLVIPFALVARFAMRDTRFAIIELAGMTVGAAMELFRRDKHPRSMLVSLSIGAAGAALVLQLLPPLL